MLRKIGCWIAAASLFVSALCAQKVSDPKASYINVAQRHAVLANNSDPRTASAIASLGFCTRMPVVQPPTGRMNIPHHYLSGSHGPTNPAEAVATRVYSAYEKRVTAGMNQWLVTASKDEAQCVQQQIDMWAQGGGAARLRSEGEFAGVVPSRVDAECDGGERVGADE